MASMGNLAHESMSLLTRLGRLASKFMSLLQLTNITISVFFLLVIVGLMFVEVVSRNLGGSVIAFAETIIRLTMGWTVFLLLSSVARLNEHIRIGFFIEKALGQRAGSFVYALENIVMIPLCIYLGWVGYRWVAFYFRLGFRDELTTIGGPTYPTWIPMVILPIGLFLCAAFYLERMITQIHATRFRRKEQGQDPGDDSGEASDSG
ncbi:TRAP transporter small permease [Chloroflexota bacterium]